MPLKNDFFCHLTENLPKVFFQNKKTKTNRNTKTDKMTKTNQKMVSYRYLTILPVLTLFVFKNFVMNNGVVKCAGGGLCRTSGMQEEGCAGGGVCGRRGLQE